MRPLYLAAPITGLLLALVPLAHTGDVRPSAGGELAVYYALALAVAAPGLGLLERSRAPAPRHLVRERMTAHPEATRPMMPGVRAGLVAIASVIFWLGLSLFVFPTHTDDLFAWTIQPPLTAAFLGASYWASTTLAVACASERDWARGRAFAAPYFIAGAVLLWVTIVHWDRFHMDEVTGWLWLILYAIFPPSVLLLLGRQLRTPGTEPPRGPRIATPLLALIGLQGAVMVALGTALVVAPEDAASLWPWELTPLTGRAIGTFVLSQGTLSLMVCLRAGLEPGAPADAADARARHAAPRGGRALLGHVGLGQRGRLALPRLRRERARGRRLRHTPRRRSAQPAPVACLARSASVACG